VFSLPLLAGSVNAVTVMDLNHVMEDENKKKQKNDQTWTFGVENCHFRTHAPKSSTFTHFLVRGRASFTAPLLSLGLQVTCGILDLCFYTVFLIEPHTDSYDSLSNPTTSEDNNVSPNSCRSESWFTS
jgi:hypothetical protein